MGLKRFSEDEIIQLIRYIQSMKGPPAGGDAPMPASAPLPAASAPLPAASAPLPAASAPLPGQSAPLPKSGRPPRRPK